MQVLKKTFLNYSFLLYVIRKYKDELPYDGQIGKFASINGYNPTMHKNWSYSKINTKTWVTLQKDLEIARLKQQLTKRKDKEKILTLEELYQEFQLIKK